jgi:hypothetical protein
MVLSFTASVVVVLSSPGFTSKAQHNLVCKSIHGKKSKNRIGAQQESPPKVLIQIASTKLLDRLEPKTRIFNGVLVGRYWNSQLMTWIL